MAALSGFALGAVAMATPPMAAAAARLDSEPTLPPSLAEAFGVPAGAAVAVGVATIVLALIALGRNGAREGWPWPLTAFALAAIGTATWVLGSHAGWHWGLSITGPTRSLIGAAAGREPLSWGAVLVATIPVGARLGARLGGKGVAWRPVPARQAVRRFAGGLLMGAGGTLAAGCNIGNAITGLSVLASNSAIATLAMGGGVAAALGAVGLRAIATGVRPVGDER